ncbi:MAG: hypothetical protein IT170_01935, partial [Bryobacterales bacterium]|nr:hypothetical protein [Bryobacterales bacterium]
GQVLTMLLMQNLITLERVAVDGTKVRAQVNKKTFNHNPCNSLEAVSTRAHPYSATVGERIHKPRRYPQTDA